MFLKKCDLLSPPRTLYFKRQPIPSSLFSGILTIISYTIIFSFIIYYAILYIYKLNPTIYYYTKFTEDAGIFPLNSSSLFHFIRIGNTNTNLNQKIDFEIVRIFGFESSIDTYISNKNLSKYNHWLYGPCNNDDIKNIENLVNKEFPERAACIRHYFNVNEQKYYNLSEPNFKWPAFRRGCSNDNATNYGIVIEKCRNDSLQKKCKTHIEIKSYLEHSFAILYFVDNYAEVLNYKNPYVKHLYKLPNGFFENSFTINNLNFNPSIITTNKGAFINYKYSESSYQFTQNEKTTAENTDILVSFYFWMQNSLLNYERNYERLQDLLSDIGGLESFVIFFVNLINSFMIDYIVLLDTEELILKLDNHNFKEANIKQKPSILKKANEIFNPPKLKKNYIDKSKNNKQQQSSFFHILLKDKSDISKFKIINNREAKSEPLSNIYFKEKKEINISKKKGAEKWNRIDNYKQREISIKNDVESKSFNLSLKNRDTSKVFETKVQEEEYKPLLKQNFTLYNYIFYLVACKLNNPKIKYYEIFRKEVISEENLIQNHINIFKLLKVCKIENFNPFKIKNINNNAIC